MNEDFMLDIETSQFNNVSRNVNYDRVISSTEKTVKFVSFVDHDTIIGNSSQLCHIPTFNTASMIMIICGSAVIFHDFLINHTQIINTSDLGNKIPTSADFIFNDFCAIGCSDGIIRIWDCMKWKENMQLAAHSKGDILTVKSLPILLR
jgi:WD40 repeat protein